MAVLERTISDEKDETRVTTQQVEGIESTPAQIQHRFETLRDLSDEQMTALNKKVVKMIDWRLMPVSLKSRSLLLLS